MSLAHSPKIVTDGLVFAYDMGNTKKSWKGKPTTNFAYNQNAKPESSYQPHLYTTDATWLANHPDAIICHNYQGGTLASYVNTGVNSGNWQVTHHAHWQYDDILKKPVVVMRDFDAQWKAKSWGLGQSMTSMGLGYGDTYTISWLQWTDNISKSANAGLYGQNTSGTNGFHDGQSQSTGAAAFNTKVNTWQRVYATFTVSSVRNLGASLSCYMYGHYNTRNTVKIADVQIETGAGSYWIEDGLQTRSNTEAILDMVGGNTIIANSLTYNSDGSFGFDGSADNCYIQNDPKWFTPSWSWEFVAKLDTNSGSHQGLIWGEGALGGGSGYSYLLTIYNNSYFHERIYNATTSWTNINTNINFSALDYHHYVWQFEDGTARIYVDGNLFYENTSRGVYSGSTDSPLYIGSRNDGAYSWNGKIPVVKFYDRILSPEEVKQNFNAIRGRYGL